MTQEIPPQEALRLPGNEPSFPQQSDEQVQQTSWNANLEKDSQNANSSLASNKELMFARDSNEAYNLQGMNQPENQPEFQQNLKFNKPSEEQYVGGFRVKIKDASGQQIEDPSIRFRVRETPEPTQAQFEGGKIDPFRNLTEGEVLHPLQDIDDECVSSIRPSLKHQFELGFGADDLAQKRDIGEQAPIAQGEGEQDVLLGEGDFPKDTPSVAETRVVNEMIRPGVDDYKPRNLPSINEEAELVELRKVAIVEPKIVKEEFPKAEQQAPLQEVALDERAVVGDSAAQTSQQDKRDSHGRGEHHKKEGFFTKIKHIFEHGDK